ncbi:MAG: FAD-dependent oxidoreductase, partial [Oscillospiraceae bacterium]|nr:FAD-dependent oxidoreductase [Oscillospiraceae bacterium]
LYKSPISAKLYAQANQNAIESYAKIIEEENIDCGFLRLPSYLYALDEVELEELKTEELTLRKSAIQAELVSASQLPFSTAGALRFKNQASFHPYKFLSHLAQGLEIYENSPATGINGHDIFTPQGQVRAEKILICTQFPILNLQSSLKFSLRPNSYYAMGLKNITKIEGIYTGIGRSSYSLTPFDDMTIISKQVSGASVFKEDTAKHMRLDSLDFWPQSELAGFWYAQDFHTTDGLPCVGSISRRWPHVYAAMGYCRWGMTTAMIAAELMCALVNGQEHSLKALLRPERTPRLLGFSSNILSFMGNYFNMRPCEKRCSHMGCPLKWNALERTWHCPCHGSRFSESGDALNAPAVFQIEN